MKTLLLAFLSLSLFAADPFRNIGTLTITNGISWDAQPSSSFNLYAAKDPSTNFTVIASVTTNRWTGPTDPKLNGEYVLYITSLIGTNESGPSEKVLVTFSEGRPIPPSNIQLYTVIFAASTNPLPSAAKPPLP